MQQAIYLLKYANKDDGLLERHPFYSQTESDSVRNAFILSMYFLLRAVYDPVDKLFDLAMYQIMKLGGSTSSNCAIVGGLVGAFVGFEFLPQ
jgi:ADP-ribosylglycohydrolase